ncbi:aminoglycoside phosphotransferase family protein [Actinoplanes sp. NPDC051411]|uniref:aminoglycoside phosphotransferase family protein n=1 Tax=Actinoplanes sp. NPDC051411 TaxID=3155522 RepID=UPI00341900C6
MDPPIPESIREQLGHPVLVRRLDSSPRSEVFLLEFGGRPAIVKHITSGPDRTERYQIEVAALRLAGRVEPRPVAALLATDATARVLVLEYLGGARAATEPWAVRYATALARLHSTPLSAGGAEIPRYRGPGPDDVEAFLRLARRLGVTVPPSAETELMAALERLADSGDEVLLHGDPCPDNAVATDEGIRFVDLEGARRGPGVLELAYLRIGFPTCWCVKALPCAQLTAAENAYRDTRRSPASGIEDACVSWLIQGDALVERARRRGADHLAQLPSRDWEWGTATARERLLHRLSVVAALAGDHGPLAATATLTSEMESAVKRQWPRLSALPATNDDPLTDPGLRPNHCA